MMKLDSIGILLGLLLCSCLIACPKAKQETQTEAIRESIVFRKDGILEVQAGSRVIASFDIEIADNTSARVQGLMHRETMEADQAMLFIFDTQEYQSFWMKDTYLPLDMLFIDAKLNIIQIVENTTPFSEEFIISEEPARFVLEVLAGTSAKMGLEPGQKIRYYRNDK